MGEFKPSTKVCYCQKRNLVLYVPATSSTQELIFDAYRNEFIKFMNTVAILKGENIKSQLESKLPEIPRVGELLQQLSPFCVYDLSNQKMLMAQNILEISSTDGKTWFFTEEGMEIGVYQRKLHSSLKPWQLLKGLDRKGIMRNIGILLLLWLFLYGIMWSGEHVQEQKTEKRSAVEAVLQVDDRLQTDGYLVVLPDSTVSYITYQIGKEGMEQSISPGDTLFPRISGTIRLVGCSTETTSRTMKELTFDQPAWIQGVLANQAGSRQFKDLFLRKPFKIIYDNCFEDNVTGSGSYGTIQVMISLLDSFKVEQVFFYPRTSGYPCVKEIRLKSNQI